MEEEEQHKETEAYIFYLWWRMNLAVVAVDDVEVVPSIDTDEEANEKTSQRKIVTFWFSALVVSVGVGYRG